MTSPFPLQILAMVSVAVEERGRRSYHCRNLSVSLCDLLALPLQRERAAFCWRLLQWIRLSVGHLRGQKSNQFTPSASSQTNCGGETSRTSSAVVIICLTLLSPAKSAANSALASGRGFRAA